MENNAMVVTKIKNIVIMLLNAIELENIDKVRHFLDEGLAASLEKTIAQNRKNNVRQRYDQTNVTNVQVLSETNSELSASVTIKAIEFLTDRKSGAVVRGNDIERTQRNVVLRFRKNSVEQKLSYKCPGCGAPLNLNATSFCDYCKTPVNSRFSPLVLTSIE